MNSTQPKRTLGLNIQTIDANLPEPNCARSAGTGIIIAIGVIVDDGMEITEDRFIKPVPFAKNFGEPDDGDFEHIFLILQFRRYVVASFERSEENEVSVKVVRIQRFDPTWASLQLRPYRIIIIVVI